ncbi:MAG: hypothetical protein ACK5MK_12370 [Dysgonomonas sp.]
MKTIFSANSKSIIVCLFLIGVVVSASAQQEGIKLPEGMYICKQALSENKENILTTEEYSTMGIAKCKHSVLRTLSYKSIVKGSVIIENNTGKVQVLYGFLKDKNGELTVHTYLFSLDKNGKYIDSIYAAEGKDWGQGISEVSFEERTTFICDNMIKVAYLIEGDTAFDSYILTPELRFKKTNNSDMCSELGDTCI